MMKPTEIRVGDFVYNTVNRQPEQVVAIYLDQVIVTYNDGCGFDKIDPLPITTGFLEKNEFRKLVTKGARGHLVDNGYVWEEKLAGYMPQTCSATTPVSIYRTPEGHFAGHNPHDGYAFQGALQWVHELQHVLVDCHINKQIIV